MKNLLYVFLGLTLAVACSSRNSAEVAARTAKQYYEYLLKNNLDAFVDGRYYGDSVPADYREQMLLNARSFMAGQQMRHRGFKEVKVVRTQEDTTLHVTNVFLMLAYGDSTAEEICVPMVEHDGVWYMR